MKCSGVVCIVCHLWVCLTNLVLRFKFPSPNPYSWFGDHKFHNPVFIMEVCFSPTIPIAIGGHGSPGWHLWPFIIWRRFLYSCQALKVSIKKPAVILMGLPLYVTQSFSHTALTILFLFCPFCVLTIM